MNELLSKVDAIKSLQGLKVELVGSWIWVSGDTKTNKAELKQQGFYWASKKSMWYYHLPQDRKVFNRHKPMEISDIKNKYGSLQLA